MDKNRRIDEELEEYVLNVTTPMELSREGSSVVSVDTSGLAVPDLIIERVEEPGISPWQPTMPQHAEGDQHLNFGLDLYSATYTESEVVYNDSVYQPNVSTPVKGYHYAVVRTGIRIQLPYGYHMMIGSRSGLGFKRHINAFPGIIDHSYRGEIMVKLQSPLPFSIDAGEKIAQGLVFRSQGYTLQEGEVDRETSRGEKGFGSTDQK